MRTFVPSAALILVTISISTNARAIADDSITPVVELQSGPLTPALVLDGAPRPIHQIRLLVDAKMASGILVLDGNFPKFDEFGRLVGGLQTPHVRGKGDP
ncbi:MAG: hypothetical protein HKN13_01470, partial [Rhodothermales bacterium]|nr:hypothetical protein [Rhodothermales bacterium]